MLAQKVNQKKREAQKDALLAAEQAVFALEKDALNGELPIREVEGLRCLVDDGGNVPFCRGRGT